MTHALDPAGFDLTNCPPVPPAMYDVVASLAVSGQMPEARLNELLTDPVFAEWFIARENARQSVAEAQTKYVLGFLFNRNCSHVILMRKRRPEWQKGFLNGIGGHVESGEHIYSAMIREAAEEFGVGTIWTHYVNLSYPKAHVACFSAADQQAFNAAMAKTDEPLEPTAVASLPYAHVIPNLLFLIPMGLHAVAHETMSPVDIPLLFAGAQRCGLRAA